MQMKEDYKGFIFVHIPKCGGTSFRKFIFDAALKSEIDPSQIYIPGFNGLSNELNIPKLPIEQLLKLKKQKLKVIANHTHFNVHKDYGLNIKKPFYYTILRNPVDRFISHYSFFYYKNGYENFGGKKLNDLPEEVLDALLLKLGNVQTRFISNVKFSKAFGLDNILKVAKFNLEHEFSDFGILEDIPNSIDRLESCTPNWLTFNQKFPNKNTNKIIRKEELSSRIIDKIKMNNSLDISLYKFAKQLIENKTSIISY